MCGARPLLCTGGHRYEAHWHLTVAQYVCQIKRVADHMVCVCARVCVCVW